MKEPRPPELPIKSFYPTQKVLDEFHSKQMAMPTPNQEQVNKLAEEKYPMTFYDGTLTLDDKNFEIKRNAFIAGFTAASKKTAGIEVDWDTIEKEFYDLLQSRPPTQGRKPISRYDIFNFFKSRPELSQGTASMKENHPEDFCQKCGGRNPVWYAPNELWNLVNGSPNGIICPVCFQKMADEKGLNVILKMIEVKDDELSQGQNGEGLLRELTMRGNFALPVNEQDLKWFDEGMNNSGDFIVRLFRELGLGQPIKP